MGSRIAKEFWSAVRRQGRGRRPIDIRFDRREGSPQEKARLNARLGVAVPTAFSERDIQLLIALKDRLVESVGDRGRLMMVIDSFEKPTHREFVLYAEPTFDFSELHSSLEAAFPELEVQMQVVTDPQWAFHQEFVDMMSAEPQEDDREGGAARWLAKLRGLFAPPPARYRQPPSCKEEEDGGSWKVGVLTDASGRDGQTIILRLDVSLEPDKRDPRFDTRLGVAVPSKLRKEDDQRFEELEDRLIAELAGRGRLALVITGVDQTTFREFVCYVERGTDFPALHDRLQAAFRSFDVQMYAETDPDWEVYEEMKAALYR